MKKRMNKKQKIAENRKKVFKKWMQSSFEVPLENIDNYIREIAVKSDNMTIKI